MFDVRKVYNELLKFGIDVKRDGKPRREVIGWHGIDVVPDLNVPLIKGLGFYPPLAVANVIDIVEGRNPGSVPIFHKTHAKFLGPNGKFAHTYGERIANAREPMEQLAFVKAELEHDPHSTRAVATIWDGRADCYVPVHKPCTIGFHFMIDPTRGLTLFRWMRSQDLLTGFLYDCFESGFLHQLVAGWLGVGLGNFHMYTDSMHYYVDPKDSYGPAEAHDILRDGVRQDFGASGYHWRYNHDSWREEWKALLAVETLVVKHGRDVPLDDCEHLLQCIRSDGYRDMGLALVAAKAPAVLTRLKFTGPFRFWTPEDWGAKRF